MEKVREVAVPNLVVVFLLLFPALWFDFCSVQCSFKLFQAAIRDELRRSRGDVAAAENLKVQCSFNDI